MEWGDLAQSTCYLGYSDDGSLLMLNCDGVAFKPTLDNLGELFIGEDIAEICKKKAPARIIAVLQLLYTETTTAAWIFPQEKAILHLADKATSIGEPL